MLSGPSAVTLGLSHFPFIELLALSIYPLAATLTPNPVLLVWQARNGPLPIPAHLTERVERAGRYMIVCIELLVVVTVVILMRKLSVPSVAVGLRVYQWHVSLFLGCVIGLIWVALLWLCLRSLGTVASKTDFRQRGSVFQWFTIYIAVAFSEEFWRAFCLVLLLATPGRTVAIPIALTTIAFGLGHLPHGVPMALGAAMSGLVYGILFIWTGSLLAPAFAHFISDLGGLWWIRAHTV